MPDNLHTRNNLHVEGNLDSDHTLVFGHGFGTDQTAWDVVKQAFSKDYKLVLYDNVGAGGSDFSAYSPAKYQTLNGYANDLVEICRTLNLVSPVFIGHSASAMVGLLALLNVPDLFSKVVLITPSPRYLNDAGYIGGFEQADLDALYASVESDYLEWTSGFSRLAMGNSHKPGLGEAFARTLRDLRPDIALHVIKSIFQSDLREVLPYINHEVLIVQSSQDIAVAPEVGPYLNKHLKNSTLVKINAEGHLPHISSPDEVIKAIGDFLSRPVC